MNLGDATARERAASDFSRNLVVTAGAGTGKTSLLIERILHLILERGVRLERIAAITFTKKAAAEMRERLEDALERVLEIASGNGAAPDGAEEADRVHSRLAKQGKEAGRLAAACHAALEALDGASIGTLHAFASGLLRRHAAEAGVDVGFTEDEGERATELFDELWAMEVETSLGSKEVPGSWKLLLEQASIDDVEDMARALVRRAVPPEALGDSAGKDQLESAKRLVEHWRNTVDRIRKATTGRKDVNRNLPGCLESMSGALDRLEAARSFPCALDELKLPKSSSLGERAELPAKKELERELVSALAGIRKLAGSDSALAQSVALALGPFVERFRAEHLRRGYVSLDGLIALTRDLLRDRAEVRREEGRRFDHILVDEFQDTDPLQYEIVLFLAEQSEAGKRPAMDAYEARLTPGKLFIVGDAKQSIYHFRGADIRAYSRAVRSLEREGAECLTLETNFRSVPGIVEPLNDLFSASFDPLRSQGFDPAFDALKASRSLPEGAAIEIWSTGALDLNAEARRAAEAKAIAGWIHCEIAASRLEARNVAVLFRSRSSWIHYLDAFRKLGIPYVLQGGKGFFSRFEVEILVSILKAIASPSDPVALVSCLRSPVFAVPDRELRLHVETQSTGDREVRPSPWSILAEPDAQRLPELARALRLLRGLAAKHADLPLDRLAQAVLEETPLVPAMASMYDGAQRVLNLEKAVRRISSLASDGRHGSAEILAHIEREESSEVAGGDSPLADETHDAVRVLTVHGAKGLEWPVVILPDLARTTNRGRTGTEAAVLQGKKPLLALKLDSVQTPARIEQEIEEKLHDEAESKRLLYVATTRARDRLVLVAGAAQTGTGDWIEALGGWGYSTELGFPDVESFRQGTVLHRREPDPRLPDSDRGRGTQVPELIEASRRFLEARREAEGAVRPAFRSPSDPDDDALAIREADGEDSRAGAGRLAVDRVVAKASGSAIHLLLELWDRGDAEWLFQSAEKAARIAAARARIDARSVLDGVLQILEEAKRSKALARIAREATIAREIPLLFQDPDGVRWEGAIDCIAGSDASPRIVDYKTGAPVGPDELARRHGKQVQKYAEAVQRALGLLIPPTTHIEPLRGG